MQGRIPMERRLSRQVSAEEGGMILGEFLRQRMGLTRKEISKAKFRDEGICVDGRQRKVNAVLQAGQYVEVLLDSGDKVSAQLRASERGMEILYEDGDVIVLNKPAGLSVHPAGRKGFEGDTLANRLAFYLRGKGEDCVIRIFGRLDRDTSGVVLAAKNQAAAARLERQREAGTLHKTYLAVCLGVPREPAGEIEVPLAPDSGDRRRMQVSPDGKPARTRYEVLKIWNIRGQDCALVRLRLDTGRMHQIRVHMAYIGCPLLGDPLYGGSADGEQCSGKKQEEIISRTALHAAQLHFCQPFGGEEIRVDAPLPKDIARILNSVIE